jgi:hypothetical protein
MTVGPIGGSLTANPQCRHKYCGRHSSRLTPAHAIPPGPAPAR